MNSNLAAVCLPKTLSESHVMGAARRSVEHNPQNAPLFTASALRTFVGAPSPLFIAALTSKWWRSGTTLTVGFLDSPPFDLQQKILDHLNAWSLKANISFVPSNKDPVIRITRSEEGYWSYVGTDILSINPNEATMCLQGFTAHYPDSEFKRVVRHEAGHTLGFVHEHSRRAIVDLLDPQKTIKFFQETQGWTPEMIQSQILTPLDESDLTALAPETNSIMCYQFPGVVTKTGEPILGGSDITEEDYQLSSRIYPGKDVNPLPPPPPTPLPLPPPPPPSTNFSGTPLTFDGKLNRANLNPGQSADFTFTLPQQSGIVFEVSMNLGRLEPKVNLNGPQGASSIVTSGHTGRVTLPPGNYQLQFRHPQSWRGTSVQVRCWRTA
jgi:hypothetical protein